MAPGEVRVLTVGPRTLELVQLLVAEAPTDVQLARRMSVTVNTVKTMLKRLYRRADACSRTDLVLKIGRGEVRLISSP